MQKYKQSYRGGPLNFRVQYTVGVLTLLQKVSHFFPLFKINIGTPYLIVVSIVRVHTWLKPSIRHDFKQNSAKCYQSLVLDTANVLQCIDSSTSLCHSSEFVCHRSSSLLQLPFRLDKYFRECVKGLSLSISSPTLLSPSTHPLFSHLLQHITLPELHHYPSN